MSSLLFIPWFKPDPFDVPTLNAAVAVILGMALAALVPKWRPQAVSTGGFFLAVIGVAYLAGWEEIPIQPFGILVATGVLLGTRYAEWFAREKHGINPSVIADFGTHVIVIGFIACYFLNGIFYETDKFLRILENPKLLFSEWLGLSSYGGFFGAIFAIWVWKIRRKLPVLQVADITCFALPLGWMFGRMGCFVVHDHPGRITDFPLAVSPYRSLPDPATGEFVARHDLGFYEVLWAAAVVVLFWALRNRIKPIGWHCAALPLLYAPVRFFLDYLRVEGVDNADVRWSGLTPGQYSSIIMLGIGLAMLWYVRTHEAEPMPEDMRWPPPDRPEKEAKGETRSDDGPSPSAKRKKRKKSS